MIYLTQTFLNRPAWRAWLIISVVIAALSLFMMFVAPRPYYVSAIDFENDYYYNTRLILDGQTPQSVHHPGTPLHYLGALLMTPIGTDPSSTQTFFNAAYLLILGGTVLSLALMVKLTLKGRSFGFSLLVLASIATWPSFATYLNYWGPTAFITIVGLPILALFWTLLSGPSGLDRRKLLIIGAGIGLLVAIKGSFIPAGIVLTAALSLYVLRRLLTSEWVRDLRRPAFLVSGIRDLSIVPGTALLTFFILTLPVFGKMSWFFQRIFQRSGNGFAIGENIGTLSELAPWFLVIVVGSLGFLGVMLIWRWVHRAEATGQSGTSEQDDGFDYLSGGVLLAGLGLAFIYILGADALNYRDPGHALRNITPLALAAPFFLLYLRQLLNDRSFIGVIPVISRPYTGVAVGAVAVVLIVVSLVDYGSWRADNLEPLETHVDQTIETITELREPGTRVAVWAWGRGGYTANFHYWGNYAYAGDEFDDELTESFPTYTFLRLREIDRVFDEEFQAVPVVAEELRRGGILGIPHAVYRYWKGFLPDDWRSHSSEVFAGESNGLPISVVAYPVSWIPELQTATEDGLLTLIENRFGPARRWNQVVDGVDWVIIAVSDEVQPGPDAIMRPIAQKNPA
jgi:hypothetical protein